MAAPNPKPGILYVTMNPHDRLIKSQFHNWYNNEHGPTRLRLSQIFTNGFRYKTDTNDNPEFLAVYDVLDTQLLETPTYTSLRANRSAGEAETIAQIDVSRYFYEELYDPSSSGGKTITAPAFRPIEQLSDKDAEGLVLISVTTTLKDRQQETETEYLNWYFQEHVTMLSKVPGWLRTRLFRLTSCTISSSTVAGSKVEDAGPSYIALHDYAKANGLGGPEHNAATSTPWVEEVNAKYVATKTRQTYKLFYVFGPAPRDLDSIFSSAASLIPPATSETTSFKTPDGRTTTTMTGKTHWCEMETPKAQTMAVIESHVTTKRAQHHHIPYQLEGNPSPTAPVIVFSNSLLTDLHMWDPFVEYLRWNLPHLKILRYDTRGRHSIPQPPEPVTLDVLVDDLAELLDGLRIEKVDVLVGVSLGGVTVLKFASKFPNRVGQWIGCDFNVMSSEKNTEAWKARIELAEKNEVLFKEEHTEAASKRSGIKELGAITVQRWFHHEPREHREGYNQGRRRREWIQDMVAKNDIEGFRYGCQALWDYDLREEMKGCEVPGLLIAGKDDGRGALVKAMQGWKGGVGKGDVELRIVPGTGHLPMCEDVEIFWWLVKHVFEGIETGKGESIS